MIYGYDKLWKKLIDLKMTKTEMRLKAGISTNVLAKLGKNEPISLENLAKIATVLNCGLDDILDFKMDKKDGK